MNDLKKILDNTVEFEPLGQYILAEPMKMEETTTNSGLYIPSVGSREKYSQVVKIKRLGSGRLNDKGEVIPFRVKEGDIVYIRKYMGLEFESDSESYLVIDEDSIIGIKKHAN